MTIRLKGSRNNRRLRKKINKSDCENFFSFIWVSNSFIAVFLLIPDNVVTQKRKAQSYTVQLTIYTECTWFIHYFQAGTRTHIVRLPLQPTTPHWETPPMTVRAIFAPVCCRRTARFKWCSDAQWFLFNYKHRWHKCTKRLCRWLQLAQLAKGKKSRL